jgi:hypothetical protein
VGGAVIEIAGGILLAVAIMATAVIWIPLIVAAAALGVAALLGVGIYHNPEIGVVLFVFIAIAAWRIRKFSKESRL